MPFRSDKSHTIFLSDYVENQLKSRAVTVNRSNGIKFFAESKSTVFLTVAEDIKLVPFRQPDYFKIHKKLCVLVAGLQFKGGNVDVAFASRFTVRRSKFTKSRTFFIITVKTDKFIHHIVLRLERPDFVHLRSVLKRAVIFAVADYGKGLGGRTFRRQSKQHVKLSCLVAFRKLNKCVVEGTVFGCTIGHFNSVG